MRFALLPLANTKFGATTIPAAAVIKLLSSDRLEIISLVSLVLLGNYKCNM
ncbi:MAG: hypothetical protein ACJA0E_001349 [Bermanella sp.]|jgi:hypothetical protein